MHLEKSKKRIAKKVKMGFKGYPQISIAYFGPNANMAKQVVISFIPEEGSDPMVERFSSDTDVREDEVIQSTIVKIIERSGASTVSEIAGVEIVS